MRSKKLNHAAAGLLTSFVSRNNDFDGYWALGMLCREAARHGDIAALDLLAPDAQASSPAARAVARQYAAFLRRAIERLGLAPAEVTRARIDIRFNVTGSDSPATVHGIGDVFACRATLACQSGRIVQRTVYGRCLPYTPGAFSRSTRVPPPMDNAPP